MCACRVSNCKGCDCGCAHTWRTLDAYREGLRDAEQAVADALFEHVVPGHICINFTRSALAAIDALRQPPPLTAHYDPAAKDNRP